MDLPSFGCYKNSHFLTLDLALGIEFRAFCMLGKYLTTELYPAPIFFYIYLLID